MSDRKNDEESRIGLLSGDNLLINNSIPFVDDDGGGGGVAGSANNENLITSANDKIKLNNTSSSVPPNNQNNSHNKSNGLNKSNANDDDDDAAKEDDGRRKSLVERKNLHLKIVIDPKNGDDNKSNASSRSSSPVTRSPEDYEKDDTPGPLKPAILGMRGLRRNSISMPVLNEMDLDALRQAHMEHEANIEMPEDAESMNCSIMDQESDHEDIVRPLPTPVRKVCVVESSDSEEEVKPKHKTPFRNKRRSSIAPLPSLRLNDGEIMANEFDSQSVLSNQNSITSVSSLASLLKEKMQMFPSMIRKRKKPPKDYKIRAFVGILFFIIVFLVGYAYIMYNQQVLARSYFDKVKFNKATRKIKVFDGRGLDVITGELGMTIHIDKPYHCLANNLVEDGSICLEWSSRARLYLNVDESLSSLNIRCYMIHWQSLAKGVYPTDCFDISEEKGHWYGGGITKDADWPLEKGSFNFHPFITGDANTQQWGNAVKRYFLNSRGAAIEIDERTPLYVSINRNQSQELCLQGRHDDFAYVNHITPLPELKYKICIAEDMKILHNGMTQKSLWDGLKEQDINLIHAILEEPVWQIPEAGLQKLTETLIYNYTEAVIALGYLRLGHVLINEFWQKHIGDFTLDEERFPTLDDTINMLHRRGFRISFTVQPFISTESANFAEIVNKKLLIYERASEKSIPALTRYKSLLSAGILDVTNNSTIPWLLTKLEALQKKYQIDSFYLDYGTAYNIPRYYQCNESLDNPDEYKTKFTSALDDTIGVMGVGGAVSVPRPPTFLSLPPVNSSWKGLQSIIPTVLSYGTIGYPFIMPGPVGGDFLLSGNKTRMLTYYSLEVPPLPSQELYLRWLQLASFLPVLRFTHLPSEYKTDFVTEVAKELTAIRQKTVIPLLKKYLNDAMNEGLPLVRPLWMLDPQDSACLFIDDEFSVGDELIVAPILQEGETKREVYLPQGVWKDGIDGSLRKGSRWIHNYRVPEDKVAYFVKMPDNTRF